MTEVVAHFIPSAPDVFQPTRFAQSHWGEDHLNGPALVGLAAHALESAFGLPEFLPARLTVDLFKAARGVPTTTKVALIRDGRRVRNSECELVQDGVTVARATLVQYRRSSPPRGEEWFSQPSFEPPADIDPDRLTYMGSDAGGWSRAIADHQNTSRKRFINRTITVVRGEANSPFVRAAMAAEGTSLVTNLGSAGVGYINGDLTVALSRLPVDEWIGVQADSHWTAEGLAVGASTLFDHAGAFGTGLVTAVSNPAAQIDFTNDPFPDRGAPR
ncbi:acyl-CoA thioesterase domain-containing protein [Mycolicibacterium mageritense]|uniref:acyl-CoA thioesterase domain-containing protein n=1 Tax=Mycolicibacterium mageritense TaxID=53462 RepID=UPI0011D87540|nr:acyl-CoA thioesterase domain-containing protein [Mycolicibacterium mageritense]TXI63065.1 MAG: thioesterase family protein [Mycolicibacterium mageritense]